MPSDFLSRSRPRRTPAVRRSPTTSVSLPARRESCRSHSGPGRAWKPKTSRTSVAAINARAAVPVVTAIAVVAMDKVVVAKTTAEAKAIVVRTTADVVAKAKPPAPRARNSHAVDAIGDALVTGVQSSRAIPSRAKRRCDAARSGTDDDHRGADGREVPQGLGIGDVLADASVGQRCPQLRQRLDLVAGVARNWNVVESDVRV